VVNAMDAPYHGRILRLRLQEGRAPSLRELKGATLSARSPSGEEEKVLVLGFSLAGGRPSDARLTRTGRVDLLVEGLGGEGRPAVDIRWEVSGPH
jgi:hypothetical protein